MRFTFESLIFLVVLGVCGRAAAEPFSWTEDFCASATANVFDGGPVPAVMWPTRSDVADGSGGCVGLVGAVVGGALRGPPLAHHPHRTETHDVKPPLQLDRKSVV